MYNFGRDDSRLWRSTTPRAGPLSGSQVSLRRRVSGDEAADFTLPRERAVDVPANFVTKPRRGATERPDPAPPPPPATAKKKKRKLPRLKIRFTRKKRSAQVEWPAEALEAAAAVERAASASPPATFTDSQTHGVRGTRLFPALGERPPHVWADDVASSGLGSSWETGLSVCSSSAVERSGLVRHPSLRPSVRRFLRAGYVRRSGSPACDPFRRSVSCPWELSWGVDEPEHPAVPLGGSDRPQRGTTSGSEPIVSVADDASASAAEEGLVRTGAQIMTSSPSSTTADSACDSHLPVTTASEPVGISGSSPNISTSTNSNPTIGPSASSISRISSDTTCSPNNHTINVNVAASPTPTETPSTSLSVERTFASQLAHHRPVAAGIRHYWKVRHEEERLGTFHAQETSVKFEQLPRNIQPFVLYHRPLVAEVKTYWARRRKALRERARNCAVDDATKQDSGVDRASEQSKGVNDASGGGDGVLDIAVVSIRIEGDEAVREDTLPAQRQDSDDESSQRDDETRRRDNVKEPKAGDNSVGVETRPAPDSDSVDQARADLDGLEPQVDLRHVLSTPTLSRPPPPRRARAAALARAEREATPETDNESWQDAEQVSSGPRSDMPAEPEAYQPDTPPGPADEEPGPKPVLGSEESASGPDVTSSSRKSTPPAIVPIPVVMTTEAATVSAPATAEPTDTAPLSAGDSGTTTPVSNQTSSAKTGIAIAPIRTSSIDSSADSRGDSHAAQSGSDSIDTFPESTQSDPTSSECCPGDLSRTSSFASARSFWRSLQDLRPIQENERLRKKVSFREEQVKKRKDPLAVFFRHLLHKSESAHDINRPPPTAPAGGPQKEAQRSTLSVEPRRRVTHTNSLPNAVVARVEPKPNLTPQASCIRDRHETWQSHEPRWLHQSKDTTEKTSEKHKARVSPSVRRLRQLLGSKPVQPVAPYHLQRQEPATASSRRFIRPGVVRQLQAQFESLARQH